MDSMSTAAVV